MEIRDHGRSRRPRARTRAEARCERAVPEFQADPRCRRHRLAAVRPRRRQRQYAVGGPDRRTRQGAGANSKARGPPASSSVPPRHPASSPAPTSTRFAARPTRRPSRPTIGRAHAVIDRLEALRVPTVAVIHGFCLGGGLEVALACQMRIAIDDARFGFPEVMLGLHPGPRRHRALHATGQSDAGDDADADRQDHRRAQGKIARAGRRGDAGAARPQRGKGCGVRPPQARRARTAQYRLELGARARRPRLADARRGRQGGARGTLSRALCADRSLGKARRRQIRDAARREGLVRQIDGDADGAEPDPGVFPARADEETRRHAATRSSMSMSSAPARWAAISPPGAPGRTCG